jgi:hypothetical protein
MKKTPLLVALPLLALSGLLLSGCGMFRSHKAWDTAQQESPLEIPPQLDRPTTTAALVIPPPGGNQPTANGATASINGGSAGAITDGFVMASNVDDAYKAVGAQLADGSLGQVTAHDDAARTYTVSVPSAVIQQKKKGFFGMFKKSAPVPADASGSATHPVQIMIDSSGTEASEVRAQGDAPAVIKVVDALRTTLGKKKKDK